MKIRLNLATNPLQTHRRFLTGSAVTAAIGGIVFVALGLHVYSARKVDAERRIRADKNRREMIQLEGQRSTLDAYFHQKDIANLHDRATFINGILDARGFNWTLMFMDLERILPGGVRVISIEPKQVGGHVEVKLTVGAINDETELKFERALEDSKEFSRLKILDVHNASSQGNNSSDQKIIQLTTVYSRS